MPDAVPAVPDQCGGEHRPRAAPHHHRLARDRQHASYFLGERGPVRFGELLARVVDEMVTDYEFSGFG
jgi:hypothetical protein